MAPARQRIPANPLGPETGAVALLRKALPGMTARKLNRVFQLFLIAQLCGPQFLDNADSFDKMIGRGRFAKTDSDVIDAVRRLVKTS